MFIKRNQVYYYNTGNNKSILLEGIDAYSFEKVFQTTIYPTSSIDTSLNPRAGETDQTYCIDYQGAYLIEEYFDTETTAPNITIYFLPSIDANSFSINKMLFPYYKDKQAVYSHINILVDLNPRAYNKAVQIDQLPNKQYKALPFNILYQYPAKVG
ncbi:MAG TPA: hypothetical protein DCS93_16460 [Microscillaceae bacterium]|nr:hypothetical protein [Microscillaceae bacterium]